MEEPEFSITEKILSDLESKSSTILPVKNSSQA